MCLPFFQAWWGLFQLAGGIDVGPVLRPLGARCFGAGMLRVLRIAALPLIALSLSGPAQSAGETTPLPMSRSLVSLPENQVPSMRMQNFGGSVYERLAIRRGLVAAGVGASAIGGATWAGKEVSARMPAATASTWRNVAVSAGKGAVFGAATGCAAGAAAGLVTGGALSLPGCMAGGFGNAIVMGFLGAYGGYVNLDEGGTVRVPLDDLNQLIKLAGSNAAQTTTAATAQATLDDCPYNYTDRDRISALYVKYGTNRRYACASGTNEFKVAVNVTLPMKDGAVY